MKITLEEMGTEIAKMGLAPARERLSFFRESGAISDSEYITLLDIVSRTGDKEFVEELEELTDVEKISVWVIFSAVIAVVAWVISTGFSFIFG